VGDRANIFLVDRRHDEKTDLVSGIYLYTHWSGYNWPEALREALLEGKGRWGDEAYLARIITSHVFADIHGSETGGGISTVLGDNSYPITVCDLVLSEVSFADEGSERDPTRWRSTKSFTDYTAQDKAEYTL
jgi:hypothetical protein